MSGAEIGGRKPVLVTLQKAGDVVFWCACGRSARQPFCDGSHKGTAFSPLRVAARHDGDEALFCTCKRTKTPPWCDGSHNALGSHAKETDEGAVDWARAIEQRRSHGEFGRADLDGGCYVLRPDLKESESRSGWRILPVITRDDGSRRLSQFILRPEDYNSSTLSFGAAETALFVAEGNPAIEICGKTFDAPRHSATTVRAGESFLARPRGAASPLLLATVCPPAPPSFNEGGNFDSRFPKRVILRDSEQKTPMGERFYQVLTSAETGADDLTQFIGGIPRSRAEPHRHLYEEALYILSGRGVMWTETKKAPVGPGDVVYLPRKQLHALECTSPEGMLLAGSFFPAGSPAVNY